MKIEAAGKFSQFSFSFRQVFPGNRHRARTSHQAAGSTKLHCPLLQMNLLSILLLYHIHTFSNFTVSVYYLLELEEERYAIMQISPVLFWFTTSLLFIASSIPSVSALSEPCQRRKHTYLPMTHTHSVHEITDEANAILPVASANHIR